MPQNSTWSEFGAGWTPSDDSINGRKNGLLKMENVELDRNGAVTLSGGTTVSNTLTATPVILYAQQTYTGTVAIYSGTSNGAVQKDGIEKIAAAGAGVDKTIAFGTAFDYTLIARGITRIKNNVADTFVYDLGVGINTTAPYGIGLLGFWKTVPIVDGSAASLPSVMTGISGTWTQVNFNNYSFAPPNFVNNISTSAVGVGRTGSTPADLSVLRPYLLSNIVATTSPFQAQYVGNNTPDDVFTLRVACPSTNNFVLVSVQLDIFVSQPSGNNYATYPSDYFSAIWYNQPESGNVANYLVQFRRSDFTRTGTGSYSWNTAWGYRITVKVTTLPNGTAALPTCNIVFDQTPCFIGGDQALGGDNYQYAQVNVFRDATGSGAYQALSALGAKSTSFSVPDNNWIGTSPTSTPLTINNWFTGLIVQNPTVEGAGATETWIFRRGGNLDQWYRVAVFKIADFQNLATMVMYDFVSDQNALILGITANPNLISVASSSLPDTIYDILGPIEGRWFYFTGTMMYPSDINNAELVDPSLAIKTTGSRFNEVYLWARKVSEATVMVGTTKDIYILTGTFQTLPDGTIDIYYRPIGCSFPPRTRDACFFNNQIFYLASDGWRSISANSNQSQNLTVPNTDRLYKGVDCYGYNHAALNLTGYPLASTPSIAFPCTVAKNKLWVTVTPSSGNPHIEVYDFSRNYWKVLNFGSLVPGPLATVPTGDVICGFTDFKVRTIDVQSSRLIDGTTKQAVTILSPIFDGGASRNRKDFYTLKARVMTGGDPLTVAIVTEDGTSYTIGTLSSNASQPTEQWLDIPFNQPLIAAPHKTWQWSLTGNFSVFTLADIGLDFDLRPTPLTYLRIPPNNYGNASKKRVRVLPFVIDTLGGPVTFTPIVDGAALPGTTITTSDKTTVRTFLKTDVFGVDYGGKFSGGLFEFYEQLSPDVVQVLPIARQFDQVGPQELFRYGKVKQLELRVLPFGTAIPYIIYFNDSTNLTGTLTVVNGVEASYYIGVPKGTSGNIIRIELGPTAFDFHRYYIRLQVSVNGKDTENEWVTLGV